MNRLEERLRDAYQAAAETVVREMDPPDLTGTRRRAGWSPGWRARAVRLAAPVAAAAAIAAVAVATSFLARSHPGSTSPGPKQHYAPPAWRLSPATSLAQGYPGARIPAAAAPRYYVGVQTSPGGPTEYAFAAYVYSSASGRQTGQLTLPGSDLWVRSVASLGDGTYVAAATRDWPHFGCRSWLYQFRLTSDGQPTGLKPFVVPRVQGWAIQLAAASDARQVVLTTSTCAHGSSQFMSVYHDRATRISLSSGIATTWSPWPRGTRLVPENVVPSPSVSADGRLFAFAALGDKSQVLLPDEMAAYVMLTRPVGGPVAGRYHLVLNPLGADGVIAAALSPNGRVTFLLTARSRGGQWHERIGAYATASGKLITVLASTSAHSVEASGYLVADPSGRHLLVLGFGNENTSVLDIATHRLSALHVHYAYPPLAATW